jgi:ribonucleoside-diphosphate reductase alpha chain
MTELTEISRQVWDMKYRLKNPDGTAVDKTVEETWARVASAVAAVEAVPKLWQPRFLELMRDFRFLPGGRILAGAGTERQVTLFNCFVMGTIPDSMPGIFTHLREAAVTLQQGGGIGYDFSTLRPKGAPVLGIGADASGPLSFMEVWDAMCRTIMSAGSRRGAMMATLRCDHPDIEAFIDAKRQPGRLTNFNLSVLVSDAFMAAVEADAPWPLVFGGTVSRTVGARELWQRLMRANYDYAEPGVLFIDRINAANNLRYCETIAATNPCGEQPLPPYGACLLGSINLSRFVVAPFTDAAHLDIAAILALVPTAVRFLDNVIEISRFPLAEQAEEARRKRRIGLGVTGLADCLIACGRRYGTAEAADMTRDWLEQICDAAYGASAELAMEKGAFPLYDATPFLASLMVRRRSPDVQARIARHGIRNALLTSIAPTGTISLFANNVSSGIEPMFAREYRRKVLMPDGSQQVQQIEDDAYRRFRASAGPEAPLPAAFVDVASLKPEDHLAMQAAAQHGIDSSISKTINVPVDLPFDQFSDIYRKAYQLGCKGCTTYRPNAVRGSILSQTSADGGSAGERTCPDCGSAAFMHREGCSQCAACGFSDCSI